MFKDNCIADPILTGNINNLVELQKAAKHKIFAEVQKVELALFAQIPISIVDTAEGIIINGQYNYKLLLYPYHGKKFFKYIGNMEIRLFCKSFPFSFNSNVEDSFIFKFDDHFNIEKITYSTMSQLSLVQQLILTFDKNLKLKNFDYKSIDRFTKTVNEKIKDENTLSSFEDEIFFLQLKRFKSSDIKELMPEFYIPSAYNFHSEDFKDRLNIYEMMML